MRFFFAIVFLLCTLMSAAAFAQVQNLAATQPALKNDARREAFYRKNLVDAYEVVGRRNPKWDVNARKIMALAVQRWMHPEPDPDLDWQIMILGDQAISVGCDDSAVLYQDVRAHMSLEISVDHSVVMKLYRNIQQTNYSPFLKVFALARLTRYSNSMTTPAKVESLKQDMLEMIYDSLPDMADDRDCPPENTIEICSDLTDMSIKLDGQTITGDRKPMMDKMYDILDQAAPDSPIADVFKQLTYGHYAWDARGGGFADTVTADGWKLFGDRIATAKAAGAAALAKDTHCADAAAEMIIDLMAVDEGRAQMEKYFQLAIAADPDDFKAYENKLYYLTPKWQGSVQDQLDFGRDCLATRRWESGIPFQLLQSHRNLVEGRFREICKNFDNESERRNAWDKALAELYTARPDTWQDVQTLYDGYLKFNPQAVTRSLDYAEIALLAGHPEITQQQLDRLNADHGDPVLKEMIARSKSLRAATRCHCANQKCEDGDLNGGMADYAIALQFDPAWITVFRQRGLYKQASGDPKGGLADLQQYSRRLRLDGPDAWYGQIFIWMTQCQLGNKAGADQSLADFVKIAKPLGPANAWPPKVAAFMLDQITEPDLLAAANASKASKRSGNLCEACYYIGKKKLISGDKQGAADDFTKCIQTGVADFIEYAQAKFELKRLGR